MIRQLQEIDDLKARIRLTDEVNAELVRMIDHLQGRLVAVEAERDTWRAKAQ